MRQLNRERAKLHLLINNKEANEEAIDTLIE
jgi:hypothetical protein